MLALYLEGKFRKDLKLAQKRRKNLDKLWTIVAHLQNSESLAARHRPHKLEGEWKPCWECHIEPDWLLIWLATDTRLILVRTGTHADLF